MQPILKYYGAKWRIADWIISRMPPHKAYLEPFAGSLAVFLNKPAVTIETINDINGDVVNFFRTCRERPEELASVLQLTPWSRNEHLEAYDMTGDPLEDARRFAVRMYQSFGSRQVGRSGWRHKENPSGGNCNTAIWKRLPKLIFEAAERLQDAQIECMDALELIPRYNYSDCLIYADPPYLKSTRNTGGGVYACDMDDRQHVQLLEILKQHTGPVLLSGYDHPMYTAALQDWTLETLACNAEKGAERTECLWMNPAASMQIRMDIYHGEQNEK